MNNSIYKKLISDLTLIIIVPSIVIISVVCCIVCYNYYSEQMDRAYGYVAEYSSGIKNEMMSVESKSESILKYNFIVNDLTRKYKDNYDDGRTIANMDIEGMPWNNGYNRWFGSVTHLRRKRLRQNEDQSSSSNPFIMEEQSLTKKEARVLIFNAIVATLLVAGIFIGFAFLFILFCTKVWFR